MSAGLIVYSDDFAQQIDSENKNIVRAAKFRLTSWQNPLMSGYPYVATLTYSGAPGMLFLGDTSGAAVGIDRLTTSGGTTTVRFVSTAAVGLDVYLYREQPPRSSTFGLQVFTPTGELAFDSSEDHLAVLAVAAFSRSSDSVTITAPSKGQTRIMAALSPPGIRARWGLVIGQSPGTLFFCRCMRVSVASRQVTCGSILVSKLPGDGNIPRTPMFDYPSDAQLVIAGDYLP